jgi:NADPH:quinone reductase-like Zn-dependent oxidoreductase
MKALTFKRYGKSPDIGFSNVDRPTLQPDELLVQVHAAGLNPIDNMVPVGTSSRCCISAAGGPRQRPGRRGDRSRQPRHPLQAR